MRRALALARRGMGRVSPNPMVGAVVVRDGRIVGEGYHLYETKDHAEVAAMRAAGAAAGGADLYVTLEPCSHHGRTPPCTERIVEVGIRRVFVAVRDPNPLVSGRGIRMLRDAGIEVIEGLERARAERLNEVFFKFIRRGTPFVTLKLAMSLDGRIATAKGKSKWITGPEARRQVQRIRFGNDAILVGINTVLLDDPLLDVRRGRPKRITKVLLDTHLRCPVDARIFESDDPVFIFHSVAANSESAERLREQAKLFFVPIGPDWESVLRTLGDEGITSLLVEGGGRVAGSALQARVIDRFLLYYSPMILGGDAIAGFGPLGLDEISQACELDVSSVSRVGRDLLVDARPRKSEPRG